MMNRLDELESAMIRFLQSACLRFQDIDLQSDEERHATTLAFKAYAIALIDYMRECVRTDHFGRLEGYMSMSGKKSPKGHLNFRLEDCGVKYDDVDLLGVMDIIRGDPMFKDPDVRNQVMKEQKK